MEFKTFVNALQRNFAELTANATHLFEVGITDKDEMWNLYLDSFPEGTNEIYRVRREHDCSCCRHFIKNFGNVVVIDNSTIKTIWDFETGIEKFDVVAKALSNYIKARAVSDVYISKFARIGTEENYERTDDGNIHKWNHLFIELPAKFVTRDSRTSATIQNDYRSTKMVFKRSLEEITVESLETVLELISQNSLYKGEEWKSSLTKFLHYKKVYDKLTDPKTKDNYAWIKSIEAGAVIGHIRNHSIGTLLVDISEDVDLDTAVRKYELIVAPSNYKRPKAIYTKKMLEDAKRTVEELGYIDSLGRRHATLDDITVNNILFSNKDSAKRIAGADIFDDMASSIALNPKKFSKVEEVSIDNFISNILPTTKEIEVLFENRHAPNLVSLIAPKNKDSKSMFKWENGFGWAYSGNMTDSSMKENVKAAGGDVNGDLRFSIQWNDDATNLNDFDAHCVEPTGNEIFFRNKGRRHLSTGMLDVDIINPIGGKAAVENITWSDRRRMPHGKYTMAVHCYSNRGYRSGFKAEIEFDGQIYSFDYNKALRQDEFVIVAEVFWDGREFKITEKIPSSASSREIWNLTTNQFVPVSVMCHSPNYWSEEEICYGHKHYFFMLKDCKNTESPNGFYNEFLKQELVQHKRVFEALGSKMAVENSDDQLSGLGFSSTRRNELIVKVKGTSERVLKIKF